jgi:large conductance mechanosensitive channel
VELAVAVIIAAAFKTIIDAFVAGVVNPLLAELVGKPNFDSFTVGPIMIGTVITAAINFVMVAAVIYFFLVNPMNKYNERKKKDEEEAPPPGPSESDLLTEIRDLLKK